MNDYKELIADLRHYFYDAEIVLDAADAIEQLVKERDAARLLFENSESWKCPACAHNRAPNRRPFADCNLAGECKNTDKLPTCFEWRGVQEVEHEAD